MLEMEQIVVVFGSLAMLGAAAYAIGKIGPVFVWLFGMALTLMAVFLDLGMALIFAILVLVTVMELATIVIDSRNGGGLDG